MKAKHSLKFFFDDKIDVLEIMKREMKNSHKTLNFSYQKFHLKCQKTENTFEMFLIQKF